jgi:WD40 repeat protein
VRNHVRVWDALAGRTRAVLRGHAHRIFSLAFSPDGKLLASGSADDTVNLWAVGIICIQLPT